MPDELRDAIGAALRELSDGEGATIKAVRAQRVLVTLECAIGEATGGGRTPARLDEIAAAVVRFLGAAADSLEPETKAPAAVPNEAQAARAALGLKPNLSGKPWRATRNRPGRQAITAEWLDTDKEGLESELVDGTTARSHLLERMAEHLSLRDSEFVAEARRLAQRERRPPLESAMRVEWLNRFERYYKMWTPIFGIRHNLELALESRREGSLDDTEIYIRLAFCNHAYFLTELDSFVLQQGGLWILPDTRTEDAIADSTWFLREPMPLTKIDESILRMAFASSEELAMFLHATYVNHELRPIMAKWRKWVHSCECARSSRPRRKCGLHASISWLAFYMDALEAQWDFLADWFDLPRPGSKVVSVRRTKRTMPVFAPKPPVDKPA